MALSVNGKPEQSNGNGTTGNTMGPAAAANNGSVWYGIGLEDAALQRPRRLSFNGSDMELSDLKATHSRESQEKKIDPIQMVGLLAIATTLAVSIKYLLSSFDLAFLKSVAFRGATTVSTAWQDFLERLAHLKPDTAWSFERMVPAAENVAHALFAIAFGLLVSSFTWYVIYLDSNIPGVNPPTPFSASKNRYRAGSLATERRFHLGYITAMASGMVAFLIFFLG